MRPRPRTPSCNIIRPGLSDAAIAQLLGSIGLATQPAVLVNNGVLMGTSLGPLEGDGALDAFVAHATPIPVDGPETLQSTRYGEGLIAYGVADGDLTWKDVATGFIPTRFVDGSARPTTTLTLRTSSLTTSADMERYSVPTTVIPSVVWVKHQQIPAAVIQLQPPAASRSSADFNLNGQAYVDQAIDSTPKGIVSLALTATTAGGLTFSETIAVQPFVDNVGEPTTVVVFGCQRFFSQLRFSPFQLGHPFDAAVTRPLATITVAATYYGGEPDATRSTETALFDAPIPIRLTPLRASRLRALLSARPCQRDFDFSRYAIGSSQGGTSPPGGGGPNVPLNVNAPAMSSASVRGASSPPPSDSDG